MNVVPLSQATDPKNYGSKAVNLGKLLQIGLPVPNGIAIGLGASNGDSMLTNEAKQFVRDFLDGDKLYAVRSSALAEDAEGASWAGQFETFLDTKVDEVATKVEECHNSAKARARAYAREQFNDGEFNIAVVVQEMLRPDYAGVLFTKDYIGQSVTTSAREPFCRKWHHWYLGSQRNSSLVRGAMDLRKTLLLQTLSSYWGSIVIWQ